MQHVQHMSHKIPAASVLHAVPAAEPPCAAAAAQPSQLRAHRDNTCPGQCCRSAVGHGIAAAGPVARACGVNPRLSVQLQAGAPAAISAAATAACPCAAALWRGVSPSASCSRGSAPADNLQPAATAAPKHQSRTRRRHTIQHQASRAAGAAHQRHKHPTHHHRTHSRFTTSKCPVCAALCRAVARPALVSASTGAPASMVHAGQVARLMLQLGHDRASMLLCSPTHHAAAATARPSPAPRAPRSAGVCSQCCLQGVDGVSRCCQEDEGRNSLSPTPCPHLCCRPS